MRFLAETGAGEGGRTIPLDAVQYWLPVTGTSEVLIMSFTTPALAYGDTLAETFDDIAKKLTIRK